MNDQPSPVLTPPAEAPAVTEKKVRNPKKIFVGCAMTETMRRETSEFWNKLKNGDVPGDWEFVTLRLSGYGLPKCCNVLTYLARQTDCGRFIRVDSDMDPTIENMSRLLSWDKLEMVSGVYPQKTLAQLRWVGNFSAPAGPNGLAPAYDFGGGFCSIDLDFLDRMVEHFPETAFESEDDPVRGKIMHDLWSCGPVTDAWHGRTFSRYLTEDFFLCYRARKMGVQVWMDTMCQVEHVGSIGFLKAWQQIKTLENSSIFRAPV